MENNRYVTYSTPMPKDMGKSWGLSQAIRMKVDADGNGMDPWIRAVMLDYAKHLTDLQLCKFAYDSIGKPHESMVRYSHQIECDGKEIRTIRLGKERPGVLEIMNLHHNVNI